MDRETLAWALVFAVPVGIGITGYSAYVLRAGVFEPLAILVGAGAGLVLFALILVAGTRGSPDRNRENGGVA